MDEKNEPHVGGNTWAGGTGGRDTAGLGGKGGPYRLDAGHDVHQLSDEEKNSVPEDVIYYTFKIVPYSVAYVCTSDSLLPLILLTYIMSVDRYKIRLNMIFLLLCNLPLLIMLCL